MGSGLLQPAPRGRPRSCGWAGPSLASACRWAVAVPLRSGHPAPAGGAPLRAAPAAAAVFSAAPSLSEAAKTRGEGCGCPGVTCDSFILRRVLPEETGIG